MFHREWKQALKRASAGAIAFSEDDRNLVDACVEFTREQPKRALKSADISHLVSSFEHQWTSADRAILGPATRNLASICIQFARDTICGSHLRLMAADRAARRNPMSEAKREQAEQILANIAAVHGLTVEELKYQNGPPDKTTVIRGVRIVQARIDACPAYGGWLRAVSAGDWLGAIRARLGPTLAAKFVADVAEESGIGADHPDYDEVLRTIAIYLGPDPGWNEPRKRRRNGSKLTVSTRRHKRIPVGK